MKSQVAAILVTFAASFHVACQSHQTAPSRAASAADTAGRTRAIDAALELYRANAGSVQGSAPDAAAALVSEESGLSTYKVTIDDSNEDGDRWTTQLFVVLRKDDGTIQSIRDTSTSFEASAIPSDLTEWRALATDAAMALYVANADGIQGSSPVAGAVDVRSSGAKTSTYTVNISDGNDEGETWVVTYTLTMANESALVLSITEAQVVGNNR